MDEKDETRGRRKGKQRKRGKKRGGKGKTRRTNQDMNKRGENKKEQDAQRVTTRK